jgi:hypothetical protein
MKMFHYKQNLKSIYLIFVAVLMLVQFECIGLETESMPRQWTALNKILVERLNQATSKMKLNTEQVDALVHYLKTLSAYDLIHLQKLQKILPKTTLELLFAIQSRGLEKHEAEKIAIYLQQVPKEYHIQKIAAFDENTSHIIGREWQEIDYSGEGMTWQGQKEKYKDYGITDFKTLDNLKKFFPVESQLPYFSQSYQN